MGKLRIKAKNWLVRHPHIHAIYIQNKFRLLTSPFRVLPDFVIIGAHKSGTTSLYDFITQHPSIESASEKEPCYFSTKYKFGSLWYRSNFPTELSKYLLAKKDGKFYTGEATTSYLFHPSSAYRMKKMLPNIKLIVILRNPVDRAYSNYNYSVKYNKETLSFMKGIELEEERCCKERDI